MYFDFKLSVLCIASMLLSILCIERLTHLPPEIYRIIATYLYYMHFWPTVQIRAYNAVLKSLPYPKAPTGPYIILQSATNTWRCSKFLYTLSAPLPQKYRTYTITEYEHLPSDATELEWSTIYKERLAYLRNRAVYSRKLFCCGEI